MGRGRKKQTSMLKEKEKTQPSWTVNCSVTARNLGKTNLGGVIFGCKNNTIEECFSNQLFGLPAPHFSYVRNIDPGLPLFLFNYSDRKLHGIFEAASLGQRNISPHGWTANGSEPTPYAAQVRIRVHMLCQPLVEDQFKPVIARNYYEQKLFWFELDHAQTTKLINLFSSSPINVSTLVSQNTKWSAPFKKRQEDESNMEWGSSRDAPGWSGESQLLQASIDEEAEEKCQQEDLHQKPNCERSYSSVVRGMNTPIPQNTLANIFKAMPISDPRKAIEGIKTPASEVNFPPVDQSNRQLESSCGVPFLDGETQFRGAYTDEEAAEKYDEELLQLKPNCECSYSSSGTTNRDESHDRDTTVHPEDYCSSVGLSHEGDTVVHPEDVRSSEGPSHEGDTVVHPEDVRSSVGPSHEGDTVVHPEDDCSSEGSRDLKMKSSGFQSVVSELMWEIRELKESQLTQIEKFTLLERELIASKEEIQQLKNRCKMLESGSSPSFVPADNREFVLIKEPHANLSESIFIVGGFDGSSWLSDLGSYSPSQDLMKSLSPMSFVRSYASAAKLNGELYILGGVDTNNLCYDTVESYNPLSNQWFSRPSLNQRKGSLAGVSLNDKIFAIGGSNGVECFSDVEMFDLEVGRWIPTPSMIHKRFAPAAGEINGTIYVVGGFNGKEYLKSVERFDPRVNAWTGLANMSSKRGCHSLAVLNEKLYALGGYDGMRMVPSVEVYDPRIGVWMMGESMNDSRGYSAAVVMEQSILVIGGVKDGMKNSKKSWDGILDTVECYEEGGGWQVTNLKAIGKRSFFSAITF